jgi:galactokinase
MRNRVESLFTTTFGYPPTVICRAPGRVEFVGNHTDYNGGPVLGAAVDHGVWVAVAARQDGSKRFRSDQSDDIVEVMDPSKRQEGRASWVNYPLGVLDALPKFGCAAPEGFDYAVCADLPVGAGLSSSAAIELSSALAFITLTGATVSREILVNIGRDAENNFVGVPCGILDQGVSGFGRENQLVFIDCAGPRFETVPMPAGTHFWIFNTHTKHALVDGLYSARHQECMAAAKGLGVAFLAQADEPLIELRGADLPPKVLHRARHIVGETSRVRGTIEALRTGNLVEVGRLLTASHRSSQVNFENSTPELDHLVDCLETIEGVYGARLTGGGFGGAVMAFTNDAFGDPEAEAVRVSYRDKFGAEPNVYHLKTADGAEVVMG